MAAALYTLYNERKTNQKNKENEKKKKRKRGNGATSIDTCLSNGYKNVKQISKTQEKNTKTNEIKQNKNIHRMNLSNRNQCNNGIESNNRNK